MFETAMPLISIEKRKVRIYIEKRKVRISIEKRKVRIYINVNKNGLEKAFQKIPSGCEPFNTFSST